MRNTVRALKVFTSIDPIRVPARNPDRTRFLREHVGSFQMAPLSMGRPDLVVVMNDGFIRRPYALPSEGPAPARWQVSGLVTIKGPFLVVRIADFAQAVLGDMTDADMTVAEDTLVPYETLSGATIRRHAQGFMRVRYANLRASALLSTMLGLAELPLQAAPHRTDDFGHCHDLLRSIPQWRESLHRMGRLSAEWRLLGRSWSALEADYNRHLYHRVDARLRAICWVARAMAHKEGTCESAEWHEDPNGPSLVGAIRDHLDAVPQYVG